MECPKCDKELMVESGYTGPITHECGFSGRISPRLFDDHDYIPPNIFKKLYYRISRWLDSARYSLKCFGQRIKYGFPLYQAWDFKGWHSEIVVPRLKYLRNNLNGYPTLLSSEEWESILDKMIWAFENIDSDPALVFPEGYDHRYLVYHDDNLDNCTTHRQLEETLSPSFHKIEEHDKKIQEGLDLFAKYYLNLWD